MREETILDPMIAFLVEKDLVDGLDRRADHYRTLLDPEADVYLGSIGPAIEGHLGRFEQAIARLELLKPIYAGVYAGEDITKAMPTQKNKQRILDFFLGLDRVIGMVTDEAQMSSQRDFVYKFAHDIKTPMQFIVGYLSLISDERDNHVRDDIEYADAVGKGQRLLDLMLQDILYQEIKGLISVEVGNSDLGEATREVADLLSHLVEGGVIRFENWESVEVQLHERELVRILQNIFTNSRRYSGVEAHDHEVVFRYKGARGKKRSVLEKKSVVFGIGDNGAGIDEGEIISRAQANGVDVREFLLQGNSVVDLLASEQITTGEDIGGTGTGMGNIKDRVEALGGRLRLINNGAFGGLEYEIELPLASEDL